MARTKSKTSDVPAAGYAGAILTCAEAIENIFKNSARWRKEDDTIVQLYRLLHTSLYERIYNELLPENTEESEKELRLLIRRYVIGCVDKDSMKTYIGALNPLLAKVAQINKKSAVNREYMQRYLELYDDFMAIASLRSFKHFCLYIEINYAPSDKIIWRYAQEHGLADGMWYCFTDMAINGGFKTMFKQTPTGYFKTYSNICFIAWLFGLHPGADVLYVLGNPSVVKKVFLGVKKQMTYPKYAKVFPFYQKFKCREDLMFSSSNMTDGELVIRDSGSECSLKVASKDMAIDGTRFKWRFYDDVTRSKDKINDEQHKKDNEMYNDDWSKRRYTEFDDFEIFSGTAYNPRDLICTQKEVKGVDFATECQFKYCTINRKTRTMFVKIPKLDYDTDESTLPEKYTTMTARAERERDYETFMAMEQQDPLPPSGLPFDYRKIKTYTELPEKADDGGERSNVCTATLDLPRTGANNLSMGVHSKCGDIEYLVDVFYELTPLDGKMPNGQTALEACCDKIIAKNVIELAVEINTNSNIKTQIQNILFAKGYRVCQIKEIYSTQKKQDKIFDNQSTILEYIRFPAKTLYAPSSPMGRYMRDITTWHAKTKQNDDSIDTEAMHCNTFIRKSITGNVKARTFAR